MKGRAPYSRAFFEHNRAGSLGSARAIVPLLLEWVRPRSVIDIGCGSGAWLSVFQEYGVSELLGVDGDYVDRRALLIPSACFIAHDLTRPFRTDRRFDLVLSLEVAEHLPGDRADVFVETLTGLGPVVLFSAAIPHQGGTQHVNEQWPDYWRERFETRGYVVIDCIRRRVWQNENVSWWYAQNVLVYARSEYVAAHPGLRQERERTHPGQLALVHPKRYIGLADLADRPLAELAGALPITAVKAVKRLLRAAL